jgi:hypothetical protein
MRFFYLFLFSAYALTPGHLPNGKIKKYVSSPEPYKDLVMIGHSKASLVSKNWMENILTHLIAKEKNKRFISYRDNPDLHIIMKVNELENYIQENRKSNDYYMAWMPKCIYGYKDVLFLVVCQDNMKGLCVKRIIQSPFWSPEQIQSTDLKRALESMSKHVDMSELYENDIRYQLAWSTWNL